MALKQIMLGKKIREKQNALEALERAGEGFVQREAALETAIEEAQTAEEQQAVEEEITAFESERADNTAQQETLRGEIAALEEELRGLETPHHEDPAPRNDERKDDVPMNTRTQFFGMTAQQRDAFFANQEVKDFLSRARELGKEKRAISGAELLIPTVMLELLRENISQYSKLISRVNLRSVPGKARQNIMGTVPEAVWTEMCGKLNELSFGFNNVEVDGYKVGGFIAICNATLDDSDLNLAIEILTMLGRAIGYALDKAIVYGSGTKMPLGIVPRLAQESKPSGYSETAREWKDLHTSNILSITAANSTGIKLFQNLLKSFGAARNKYSVGNKVWIMNETTHAALMAEAMNFTANGAVVSGVQMTMPVVGGDIVLLDFVPDNNIIAGYGDLYLLAERAGTALATSEHVRFLEDQTVFKGTARYDGLPAIAEGFVAIGISGTTPTTSLTFATDTANVD